MLHLMFTDAPTYKPMCACAKHTHKAHTTHTDTDTHTDTQTHTHTFTEAPPEFSVNCKLLSEGACNFLFHSE